MSEAQNFLDVCVAPPRRLALGLHEMRNRAGRWPQHLATPFLGCVLAALPPGVPAGPFPAEIELASLFPVNGGDGSSGIVLKSIDDMDLDVSSAVGAGDVNGDGIDDLLVGIGEGTPDPSREGAGQVFVVFGRTDFSPLVSLYSLLPGAGGDGSEGFVMNGITRGDYTGFALSGAGDLNGDGIDDIVIGTKWSHAHGEVGAGEVYVVFGRDSRSGDRFPPVMELADLAQGDGSRGFMLNGVQEHDHTGRSVRDAGDVNADGVGDLIIGAFEARLPYGESNTGAAFVVFGRDYALGQRFPPEFNLWTLFAGAGGNGSEGFHVVGADFYNNLGYSVSGAGDVDGDGIDDVVIGAHIAGHGRAGESYALFGRDAASGDLFPPTLPIQQLYPWNGGDGSEGFTLVGMTPEDFLGESVGAAGDVNADGLGDVLISAHGAHANGVERAGESYLVFGRDASLGDTFPARWNAAGLSPRYGGDGTRGVVLRGSELYEQIGLDSGGAGDVNGDGIDDVAISGCCGVPGPGGRERAGRLYVLFGRAFGFPPVINLGSLRNDGGGDGRAGFVLNGVETNDDMGIPARGAGDVNGDGIDDLVTKAFKPEAYVIFGRR